MRSYILLTGGTVAGTLGDVPEYPVLLLGDPTMEQAVRGAEARHDGA